MIALFGLIAVVLSIVVGYFYTISGGFGRRKRFLARAEYWVYLPGDEMPEENVLMKRMIGANPYQHRSRPAIGTAEGLVFSDVRLHVALVLRKRNPHAFRPDLFDAAVSATPEQLLALAEAQSFVKVQYASEEPLKDARHLQFLPHMADALAELADGKLIYDVTGERLMTRDELSGILRENAEVSGADLHTRVMWLPEVEAGHAETRGLGKVGHKDLRTPTTPADQRTLLVAVIEEVVRRIWSIPALPESLEVDVFDDHYRVLFEPTRDKYTRIRVLRLREA